MADADIGLRVLVPVVFLFCAALDSLAFAAACPGAATTLSGKSDTVCAIKTDGSIACWGGNGHGEVSNVPSGTNFISVSAAWRNVCAIKADDSVVCWGSNADGVVSGAPSTKDFVAVSVGDGGANNDFACGLKTDGSIQCWGSPPGTPAGSGYVEVSSGFHVVCGVKSDNTMTCKGGYKTGYPTTNVAQVGTGDEWNYTIKTDGSIGTAFPNPPGGSPPSGNNFVFVSTGYDPVCALKTDGSIKCWGDNSNGEVSGAPGGTGYVSVAAGGTHACAEKNDGTVTCWGDNGAGQLNVPVGLVAKQPSCSFGGGGTACADSGFMVTGSGGSLQIDECGECRVVTNNNAADLYVPTQYDTEWYTGGSSFLENLPANATANACPSSCTVTSGTTWTAGSDTCTVPSDVMIADGGNQLVTDSTAPTTGDITYNCAAGVVSSSGATCTAGGGSPFDFTDVTDATAGDQYSSSATVSGVSGTKTATVVGSPDVQISKDGVSWGTSFAFTNGDPIYIHMNASSKSGAKKVAVVVVGNLAVNWEVTNACGSTYAGCASATVNWTVGSDSCSATIATGNDTDINGVTDSTGPATGSANFQCNIGSWVEQSGSSCSSGGGCTTSGLVAKWDMDETSGTTANDSSGNGYNGAMAGGMTAAGATAPGIIGNSFHFTGNNRFKITSFTIPATDKGTIAFWMNPDSLSARARFLGSSDDYEVQYDGSGHVSNELDVSGANGLNATSLPPVGSWTHVVFTFNGTGVSQIYYNGVLNKQGSVVNSHPSGTVALTVGDRTGQGDYYHGYMDDVRIYDRVLTAPEIADLYGSGTGCAP